MASRDRHPYSAASSASTYRGRFAPSPTGPLHAGSLLAAVASFVDARANNGSWLLRIDDLDTFRNTPGSTDRILHTLEACGLEWDERPLYQSGQIEQYKTAIQRLRELNRLYACNCSRKSLREHYIAQGTGAIYPGFCTRQGLALNSPDCALRIRTVDQELRFVDRVQGPVCENSARDVGDFIVRRRDGIHAYQLAVVIDDESQRVSSVVRGIDLLESTPRQIFLQQCLQLHTPDYAHVPVVSDSRGFKLSKQYGAAAVDNARLPEQLGRTLRQLGHPPPAELHGASCTELLEWVVPEWDIKRLCGVDSIPFEAD